ncbi:MAG: 50S ribosomal protein L17 [Candidatus Cloacimonadota bacterium]|nr:MAG: 50S ribosomal protein L17 [Candidatus Cloacimonadota bacterium]
MRHRVRSAKLGRRTDHQLSLRRNLVFALINEGKITTTLAKAKMVRPIIEKLITLAKKGNADETARARHLANAVSFFTSGQNKRIFVTTNAKVDGKRVKKTTEKPRVVKRLFDEIAPAYSTRPGGYTRIIKLGKRAGDAADMAVISLV